MNKELKVGFFGTSDRSIPLLEKLNSNFNLVLCVTKTDVLVGRKQELKECAVKKWARENGISFVEVDSLKNFNLSNVIEQLNYSKPDIGLVTDFSFMIPKDIISWFKDTNLLNIHFSILPKYRGASPIQHSILNGDNVTGVTYQLVHPEMDKGDIVFQFTYEINKDKTAGEIYEELFELAAERLPDVIEGYSSGKLIPITQIEENATYTYSKNNPKTTLIVKEDARIDPRQSHEEIYRMVKAFNPWPISWCSLSDLEKILDIKIRNPEYGSLVLKIWEAEFVNGKVSPTLVQIEGKSKMDWKSFKNGYLE